MQRSPLSAWHRTDLRATHAIRSFLRGAKDGILWLLGLISFASMPWLAMEYYDGALRTTWVEWTYVVLLPPLLWRHIAYCRRFHTGFWSGLNRLLVFAGLFVAVWCAAVGLITSVLIDSDMLFDFLGLLSQSVDVSGDFYSYGISLLVVYLSAPNGPQAPADADATATQ